MDETAGFDGEAPQIAQDATNPPEGTPAPSLDEMAAEALSRAQQKGMSMAERVMVIDGWALDTFAWLASMVATLEAQVIDLLRMLAALTDNQELLNTLQPLNAEEEARVLAHRVAAARLQAEIDYLDEKPGPAGPRLLIPNPN